MKKKFFAVLAAVAILVSSSVTVFAAPGDGDNYGYRSGLNASMVKHLQNKIRGLEKFVNLSENDLVLDIGSNDATSLKSYTVSCKKIGIDPTSEKFKKYYTNDIIRVPEFFPKKFFTNTAEI